MSNAKDYRAKAVEFTRLANEATFLSDIKEFLRRAQSFTALADNEEWVVANRDKIISNRAPADGRIGHAGAEALDPLTESDAGQNRSFAND
jgi:hypothetical protein